MGRGVLSAVLQPRRDIHAQHAQHCELLVLVQRLLALRGPQPPQARTMKQLDSAQGGSRPEGRKRRRRRRGGGGRRKEGGGGGGGEGGVSELGGSAVPRPRPGRPGHGPCPPGGVQEPAPSRAAPPRRKIEFISLPTHGRYTRY